MQTNLMTVPLMENTPFKSVPSFSTAGSDSIAAARSVVSNACLLLTFRLTSKCGIDESLTDIMKVVMMQDQQRREGDRERTVEERRDEDRRRRHLMEMMITMVTTNNAPMKQQSLLGSADDS